MSEQDSISHINMPYEPLNQGMPEEPQFDPLLDLPLLDLIFQNQYAVTIPQSNSPPQFPPTIQLPTDPPGSVEPTASVTEADGTPLPNNRPRRTEPERPRRNRGTRMNPRPPPPRESINRPRHNSIQSFPPSVSPTNSADAPVPHSPSPLGFECECENPPTTRLLRHLRYHCPSNPQPAGAECPGCGKMFARPDLLKRHRKKKRH